MNWAIVNTTPFQIVSDTNLLVDTSSSSITITLPVSPTIGDEVTVADANDWSVYNLILISPDTIDGSAANLVLSFTGSKTQLIYTGSTWKSFSSSKPQRKVTDLPLLGNGELSNEDVFVVIDSTDTVASSKKVTYEALKSNITTDYYNDISTIINDINAHGETLLDVELFNGNTPSYYLNYANFTNAPAIPTKTSDLSNDGIGNGFVFVSSLGDFTSDNLPVGLENKYFDEDTFNDYFDASFETSFRIYSGDFAEALIVDSFDDMSATPLTTNTSTDVLNLSSTDIQNVYIGQTLRIFGGNINETVAEIPSIIGANLVGFTTTTNNTIVSYKISQFDFVNGKISTSTTESNSLNVGFDDFNNGNTVELTFNRSSTNYGILVYRSINNGSYDLIDILGQQQLGNIIASLKYTDYGTFGYTNWSKKSIAAGTYVVGTGTSHFPLNAIASPRKGWVDTIIKTVDTFTGEVTLESSFNFANDLKLCANDTPNIQKAVDERFNSGINSLTLNARQYIISSVRLPNGFSLNSNGNTKLKLIPCSTEQTLNMVYANGVSNDDMTLSGIQLDGNQQSQWLRGGSNIEDNYIIKILGSRINLTKLSVANMLGGGIYSPNCEKMVINLIRVEDSGMNDLQEFSPLVMNDCTDIMVTTNVFRNFTSNIDLSTTYIGVFANNVVSNCGNGVLVFGSRYLISSPNLISGAAGEYISSPDILNSEYSSIDINVEYGMTFTSPAYVYQENGQLFDLTANRAELSYGAFKLRKVSNVEEEYGEVLIGGITPIANVVSSTINLSDGEFKFSISQSNVNSIIDDFSFSGLKAIDDDHVGLIYKAGLTEYTPSGTITAREIESDITQYSVTITDYANMYVGAKVRLLNHGGTPNLDNLVGTVININDSLANGATPSLIVTIQYGEDITSRGTGGSITVENIFLLAKGRLQ